MDRGCDGIRVNLTARRTGDLDPRNTAEVDAHLRGCAACSAEAQSEQSVLSLLQTVDDITPSPRVWQRLDRETRGLRKLSLTGPLKFAAAAGILAAAFSFVFVAKALRPAGVATVAAVAPGSPYTPGTALRLNERFATPAFALLTLPDVGTLKLNRDTVIVFESPRRVLLEKGELFADIRSDAQGFQVRSGATEVSVHGTRFGVRAGDTSTVYVVDGRVEVSGPGGKTTLAGQQMADGGGAARPLEDDALRWIASSESPIVALTAVAKSARLTRGDPLDLYVRFETSSPAPVLLPPLEDLLPLVRLNVTDAAGKPYLVRIPASSLRHSECRTRGPNGPVRLDVSTPCVLTLRIAPDLLPPTGSFRIRAAFQPGAARGGDFWARELESESFEVDLK